MLDADVGAAVLITDFVHIFVFINVLIFEQFKNVKIVLCCACYFSSDR